MEAEKQLDTQTGIPDEIHQLAKDIDEFWCDFDPYDEVYSCPRSEYDKEENIAFIAEDIYKGETEMIDRLQEIVGDPYLAYGAHEAKILLNRIKNLKAETNKAVAR